MREHGGQLLNTSLGVSVAGGGGGGECHQTEALEAGRLLLNVGTTLWAGVPGKKRTQSLERWLRGSKFSSQHLPWEAHNSL